MGFAWLTSILLLIERMLLIDRLIRLSLDVIVILLDRLLLPLLDRVLLVDGLVLLLLC